MSTMEVARVEAWFDFLEDFITLSRGPCSFNFHRKCVFGYYNYEACWLVMRSALCLRFFWLYRVQSGRWIVFLSNRFRKITFHSL